MKKLSENINNATRFFRKKATEQGSSASDEWLCDNYFFLKMCSDGCADACKRIQRNKKDSAKLSGLYDLCRKICRNGVFPNEKELSVALGDIDCFAAENLPLALNCALIEYAREAVETENTELLANAVKSLKRMSETDFEKVVSLSSKAEKLLSADPSGIYPMLDEQTKSVYRKTLYRKASLKNKSEEQVAAKALLLAKQKVCHAGEFIFAKRSRFFYGKTVLILQLLMPLLSSVCAGVLTDSVAFAVLTLFPLIALWRFAVDNTVCKNAKPVRLMRLKTDSEAVKNTSALITVSTIMPSAKDMDKLEKHLEKIFLSNGGENIRVCCLADLRSADSPSKPGDKEAVRAAMEVFDRLNKRYCGGFLLALRPRIFSKTQGEFTGRERKRGAISDLVSAIKGNEKAFSLIYGDKKELKSVKYLIALDSDTQLEFDGARSLISIALHPFNRPLVDQRKGRVTRGYGIIVPAAENKRNYLRCTPFEKIMAGSGGISVYDSIFSEKYQALFGESIFCGKGLIDVDAYHALLTKGLPEERILSHDIIEGGYLKVGFASDIRITESFPKTEATYFKRLHRWIRGDWQNIPFIFGKNPLNFVSRYKLFDNLLRSLATPFALVSIIVSAFIGGKIGVMIAAISAFSIICPEVLSGVSSLLKAGKRAFGGLFYSGALPCSLSDFARAFMKLAFSVKETVTVADAAVKALWRLLFSKKKLLEWSTAAMSEGSAGVLYAVFSCLPSVAVFIFLFASGSAFHRLLGLIILSDVPLTLLSGAEKFIRHEKLSEKNKDKLYEYAASTWGFFDDLCNAENNFLPPDNIQFAPASSTATHTSPTNIGLAMLSFLAARDFGFIASEELCQRLDNTLATVEKLEKYKGNLYNWYSVKTLEILEPAFISTVDSGNFICSMVALAEGLKEYRNECSRLGDIIKRIGIIIGETELGFLYSKNKKLFSIGYFPAEKRQSESCYDLLMSESRMTSFFAVATRAVPKKHWQSLGRVLVSNGRYCGLASWSGTMFEYFMPEIFICSPKGSISSESLHFCVRCQRIRAGKKPFGISESGYYAFDSALNYRYKAHGVPRIGLSKGLEKDFVISPYSSFLTLAIRPELSVSNLKKLEKLGVTGKYGFYEAIDYTKGRSRDGAVVRSFMAHHLGMSLLSADNALHGNCIQQRFMKSSLVKGAESLLEEEIQPNAKVFKGIYRSAQPIKKERRVNEITDSHSPDITRQKAAVYSNGRLSSVITDCGCGYLIYDGITATVRSAEPLGRPEGIFAVFRQEKEITPFSAAIDLSGEAQYSARFEKKKAIHVAQTQEIQLLTEISLLSKTDCEIRKFTVKNIAPKRVCGEIIVYINPCLAPHESFSAHPAFSRLFLVDAKSESDNYITVTRRTKKGEKACSMLCGIKEDGRITAETSRERVLETPESIFSIGKKNDFGSARGNPDCCCAFKIEIELDPNEKAEYTLLTVLGETEENVINTFETLKSSKSEKRTAKTGFTDEGDNAIFNKVLPAVIYPKSYYAGSEIGNFQQSDIGDLWRFGLSGDLPIVITEINSAIETEGILPYLRTSKALRLCGIAADTVILYRCEEGYNSEIFRLIRNMLAQENYEQMLGVKGGVHAINIGKFTPRELATLRRTACFSFEKEKALISGVNEPFRRCATVLEQPTSKTSKNPELVKQYSFTRGQIIVKKDASIVDIPWFLCLANKSFGTMVSDKSLGFTWALNSRENKLSPWLNDMRSDNRGEVLFLKYNGAFYDLAALGTAFFMPQKAAWLGTVEGMNFSLEVSVPEKGMSKKIKLKIQNPSNENASLEVFYYIDPVLSSSQESASDFCAKKISNGALIKNYFSNIDGFCSIECSSGADLIYFSKPEFFSGKPAGNIVPQNMCCAVGKNVIIQSGSLFETEFYLSFAVNETAAAEMPKHCSFDTPKNLLPKIETGINNLDTFCNSFLYYQTKYSRFYARTGPYQCSGAYGFRDQLQDSLIFLYSEPELCKRHILRCAAVQFEEGDVLHWWHVIADSKVKIKGVRTRCSDDMLWLPFVLNEYLKKTDDFGILDIKIPYIISDELSADEKERYIEPERSSTCDSLLNHCIKAAEYSMRYGENGFPLIGSCDWNDGFSNAGDDKNGETVWLAMFQVIVFEALAKICKKKNLNSKANRLFETAKILRKRVEEKAWSGECYNRAILKNSTVLGAENGFIDILPQAFAVFAGLKNAETAVMTAYNTLFDKENSIVRLLSPAFEYSDYEKTGYIASYPEGIRENGGQYTHAAVWLADAMLKVGRIAEGIKLLNAINPLEKYTDEKSAAAYRAEPYILAGDVSYSENIIGRAGWTHFTGSAAWYYRVVYDNHKLIKDYSKQEGEGSCKG